MGKRRDREHGVRKRDGAGREKEEGKNKQAHLSPSEPLPRASPRNLGASFAKRSLEGRKEKERRN